MYKGGPAFNHHHEIIVARVHELDVSLTEVSTIKDETYLLIAVAANLLQHVFQLRDIHDTARVALVKQGLLIGHVVSNRVVDDWRANVILRVTVFRHLNISSLAVLVGGVIGNVDFLVLVVGGVPAVQEVDPVIIIDLANEARDCRVAVNLVLWRHQWVVVGIIREVLSHVAFCDN